MSDYIKREDAIQAVENTWINGTSLCNADEAKQKIKNAPSADVVEAVRCKDCKYHEELLNGKDGNVICWVHDIDVIVDRNGYCNYGERKEQENE